MKSGDAEALARRIVAERGRSVVIAGLEVDFGQHGNGLPIVRRKTHGLVGERQGLVRMAEKEIHDGEIAYWCAVARIKAPPKLIGFDGVRNVVEREVVIAGNVQALAVIRVLVQVVCLAVVADCLPDIARIHGQSAEPRISHGALRVQIDGEMVGGNRFGLGARGARFLAHI